MKVNAKSRVVFWLLLTCSMSVLGQEKSPLVFQITYRDFLSGTCMFKYGFEAEYRRAFLDDDCSAGTYFTYNYGSGNCPCFGVGQCSTSPDYCTFMDNWDPFFLDGTISGHPDFDFGGGHILLGAYCSDVSGWQYFLYEALRRLIKFRCSCFPGGFSGREL